MPNIIDTDFQPWRVLASEKVLDYSPWLSVIRQDVQLPTGTIITDYLLTPGRDFSMTVAVLEPPLVAEPELLLVHQYKHGLGRPLVEFPAGYFDTPDEAPLACAQRELREETGYCARVWQPLGAFCIDPNRARTSAYFFFARDLACAGEPHLDATENLRHLTLPARQFPDLLRSGQVASQSTAAAWGLAISLGCITL
jgi:8-oxo-dGTP pyrophosphatase MutT (NUDIX family)